MEHRFLAPLIQLEDDTTPDAPVALRGDASPIGGAVKVALSVSD
jgi:hypothetical protein